RSCQGAHRACRQSRTPYGAGYAGASVLRAGICPAARAGALRGSPWLGAGARAAAAMSVVAVSGTSGFLGRHLCQELAARAHQVCGLSRSQLSSQDLAAGLHGVETLVHLAARAHVLADTSDDPIAQFRASNVVLT